MQNKIIELAQFVQQFYSKKEEYQENKNEDNFIDNQQRNENELIQEGEEILNNKINEREYIDKMYLLIKQMETILNDLRRELINETKEIEIEDKKNFEQINLIIETIKSIRQRKTDK